jgi:hypothetical protein
MIMPSQTENNELHAFACRLNTCASELDELDLNLIGNEDPKVGLIMLSVCTKDTFDYSPSLPFPQTLMEILQSAAESSSASRSPSTIPSQALSTLQKILSPSASHQLPSLIAPPEAASIIVSLARLKATPQQLWLEAILEGEDVAIYLESHMKRKVHTNVITISF